MTEKRFSYNKQEKLKSRKQLQALFASGRTFTIFPVKIFFQLNKQDKVLKTGVGVSSRHFKKAVERNRVKRLLREAYRTEKPVLINYLQENKKQIALFFLYVDNSLPEYNLIKQKMQQAINKLILELNEMAS